MFPELIYLILRQIFLCKTEFHLRCRKQSAMLSVLKVEKHIHLAVFPMLFLHLI